MSELKKNPFTTRRLPNSVFVLEMLNIGTNEKKDGMYTKPSFTDKEAYKLSLSSKRGDIQQLTKEFLSGALTNKGYSIPVGKSAKDVIDTSYLRRPDLTLADIDSYIARTKSLLEKADKEMALQIQSELDAAEQKAKEIQKAESKNNSEGSDSSE